MTQSAATPSDPTFRQFDAAKAATYAAYRPPYPPAFIDTVLKEHKSTGGSNELLLDVGCGPGTATRLLAPHFQHVIGVDPGQSMIETAKSSKLTPCISASGEPTKFQVCAAEDLGSVASPNSVDMISAATAAHWFDMSQFYTAASKILKPKGSIMLWCGSHVFADPRTSPHAARIQKFLDFLDYEAFDAYLVPGNRLARDLYRSLPLPWTVQTNDTSTQAAMEAFDQQTSQRMDFNTDGKPDPKFADTQGFIWYELGMLEHLKKVLLTASPAIRYREANKEQLESGEMEDVVEKEYSKLKNDAPGAEKETIGFGIALVLIMIKKKA